MQIHRTGVPGQPKSARLPTPKRRAPGRPGFTLIEMMVVIMIIGILIAILTPVLLEAQESARQIECQNNLRAQGVAIQSYQTTHGHYPTGGAQSYTNGQVWGSDSTAPRDGRLVDRNDCGTTPCEDQTWGWQYQILLHLEDGNNQLLFYKDPAVVRGTVVNSYRCPSAPPGGVRIDNEDFLNEVQVDGLPLLAFGGTDYAGNIGVGSTTSLAPLLVGCGSPPPEIDSDKAGPFAPRGRIVTPASVSDGLAHTIFVGESYVDPNHAGEAYHGHVVGFVGGWAETNSCGITGYLPTDTLRMVTDLFGPNVPPPDDSILDLHLFESFGSWHHDVAFFLTGDGSVHRVPTGFDRDVFRRLGTMAGGELIDGTEF